MHGRGIHAEKAMQGSRRKVRATWEVGLNLYRTGLPAQKEAKVACWYGEKEGHMKKAIEKLQRTYPQLAV